MADLKSKQKTTAYQVLDWGAGTKEAPCSIEYMGAEGQVRHAQTGDLVDDLPVSAIGKPGQEDIRSLILGVHIAEVEGEAE